MNTKQLFFAFLLYLFTLPVLAQQTDYHRSLDQDIQTAKELYQKNEFISAIRLFEKIADYVPADAQLHSEAAYFQALCAVKLENRNAEDLIANYVASYPSSVYANQAYYELGQNQFEHKKYAAAIQSFNQVKVPALTDDEQAKTHYMCGYSYFLLEKYDEALSEFALVKDTPNFYAAPSLYYWAHIQYLKENYQTALTEFEKLKDNPSFSKVIPFYISQIYYKQSKYEEVVKYTIPFLNQVPADEQYELAKIVGDSYFHLQQFDRSIPFLEHYFKSGDRKGREENYMMGYCYYLTKQDEKGIPFLENASKGEDKLAQNAYYHLADCYIATKDKNKARAAFEAASNMNFDETIKEDALFNFAKITYELSYSPFNETIKAFDKYIASYPNSERNDAAYDYLVKVYMSTSNYRDAVTSIEKIKVKSPSIKKAYQRVTFYRALEDFNNLNYEDAIAYFTKSLDNGQYDRNLEARANFWKAEANYRLGDFNKAIEGYNKFMRAPGVVALPEYQMAGYNLGYAYLKLKDYDNAAASFRKFLSGNEQSRNEKIADAYNRLGDCYFITRNYPLAVQNYDKAFTMKLYDPDYSLLQKAICQGLQRDNQGKINSLKSLTQDYPKSSYYDDALYELGRVYERTNQPDLAIRNYQNLIDNYPQSNYLTKALLQLGLISYNSGDFKKSVKHYKQVAELSPNSAEAQAALLGIKNSYVELNDVNSYFDFASKLGNGTNVSASEQDSLTYRAAEKMFMNKDPKAKEQLSGYLHQFPQGSFALNAHFYLAECLYNDQQFELALPEYELVLTQPDPVFLETALMKASELNYNAGNVDKAMSYYLELEKSSNSQWNLLVARTGLMRCYFLKNDYIKTIDAAKLLLSSEKITDIQKREANYKLALSYYKTEKIDAALPVLGNLATDTKSAEGAEAKYLVAEILFRKNQLSQSEKEILNFIEKNTPHQFWLAKSFILLADIYLKNNDEFQAKHTLKSIIENYGVKDDGIIDMANERLFNIEQKEHQQQLDDQSKTIKIDLNKQGNTKK